MGEKDKKAQPTTDEKGETLTDTDSRDAEYIPFKANIQKYFQDEVLPHWADAWINEKIVDERDGLLGLVGTEINFNREFYIYTPPRSREAIAADIESKEHKFMELLHAIKGGSAT